MNKEAKTRKRAAKTDEEMDVDTPVKPKRAPRKKVVKIEPVEEDLAPKPKRTRKKVVKIEIDSDEDISEPSDDDDDDDYEEEYVPKPKRAKRDVKLKSNAQELKKSKLPKKEPNSKLPKEEPTEKLSEQESSSKQPKLEPSSKLPKDEVKKESKAVKSESVINPNWEDHIILQYEYGLDTAIAKRLIHLFKEANTIPFIARYRKGETGNMTADELRSVKESIDKVDALKSRMRSIVKILEKSGKLTDDLRSSIMGAQNLEILEHLYSPYKQGTPNSLVERAKLLGLELPAMNILENQSAENLLKFTTDEVSLEDVEKGVGHIIAHAVATNTDTLSFLQDLKKETNFTIETKKARKRAAKENSGKPAGTSKGKVDNKHSQEANEAKFQNYLDYKAYFKSIKPHQILAINRGEHLKILSVKIIIPDFFHKKFIYFCKGKWLKFSTNHYRFKLTMDGIEDAYSRIITPLVTREIRAELKSKAEKASLDVFSSNLKQILLATPTKGRKILGIDPGFVNGCKLALISEMGSVLETDVIYPHKKYTQEEARSITRNILLKHSCTLVALGNATACRETETWLAELISQNVFRPLDVTYTIVSECGASIYSCGKEAKKEFPDMDPNLISAVSLARRIQEPLAELVKVEPKHLGVGMYQHDLAAKPLEEALNDVVSECVSFVGVDLNTASQCLLKHVAGLTDKKANDIIKFREDKGPFASREDLKKVKGIGANTFQQCAGFLKVGLTEKEKSKPNKLDHTIIHPEAYNIAKNIINKLKLSIDDIGEPNFIAAVARGRPNIIDRYSEFGTSQETLELILDAFVRPPNYDFRDDMNNKPLFKKNLTSLEDLKEGTVLTGRVENVTHFGCFVDLGVKTNGLIHSTKMKNQDLKIGDRVEVNILNLDIERKRIGLELLNVI